MASYFWSKQSCRSDIQRDTGTANQPAKVSYRARILTDVAEWQIEERYYVLNENDPDVIKELVKVVPGIKSHHIPETPIHPDDVIVDNAVTVGVVNLDDRYNPVEKLVNHYSSWYRLKRAIAWLLKFQELLKNKDDYNRDKANISIQDIKKVEKIVCPEKTLWKRTEESISGETSKPFQ